MFGLAPTPLQSSFKGVCIDEGNCNESPPVYLGFVVCTCIQSCTTVSGTYDEVLLESFTDSEGAIASL